MIGPSGFSQAQKMERRPEFGTAPIRCGKMKCKWRGYETDLEGKPDMGYAIPVEKKVCPTCGCDSYMFMTEKEIAAWNRVTMHFLRNENGAVGRMVEPFMYQLPKLTTRVRFPSPASYSMRLCDDVALQNVPQIASISAKITILLESPLAQPNHPRLSVATFGSACMRPRNQLATPNIPPMASHASDGMTGCTMVGT